MVNSHSRNHSGSHTCVAPLANVIFIFRFYWGIRNYSIKKLETKSNLKVEYVPFLLIYLVDMLARLVTSDPEDRVVSPCRF
jgi:hypothetical protein